MRNAPAVSAVLLSVLIASFLGRALIRASSPTYDEPVHLSAGYTDLVLGRYRLNAMDHPPLGEMWAALPLLRAPARPLLVAPRLAGRAGLSLRRRLFLYHNRVRRPGDSPGAARTWSLVTLTLLVAASRSRSWAHRLDGPRRRGARRRPWRSASPGSRTRRWSRPTPRRPRCSSPRARCSPRRGARPRRGRWPGAAAGAALAAKFNMILLPPLAACALAAEARADKTRRPRLPRISRSPRPPRRSSSGGRLSLRVRRIIRRGSHGDAVAPVRRTRGVSARRVVVGRLVVVFPGCRPAQDAAGAAARRRARARTRR